MSRTLQQQVSATRIMALVVPIILILSALIATLLAKKQITDQLRQRQEVAVASQSQAETTRFNEFITKKSTELEKIDYALPGESMIVGVIQDLETTIHAYDEAGKLSFASATPVRSGVDLTIPLTIKMKLPLTEIPQFVDTIKSLPYMIQLLVIDAQVTKDSADCTFGLKLYVQEPFTGL